jgi:hypothetical protein
VYILIIFFSLSFLSLHSDEDDQLMSFLEEHLSLNQHLETRLMDFETSQLLIDAWMNIFHPHYLFICFLEKVAFDSAILVDFLLAPDETCFLSYFVKYLKFIRADFQSFILLTSKDQCKPVKESEVDDDNTIAKVMSCFIRLSLQLERMISKVSQVLSNQLQQ